MTSPAASTKAPPPPEELDRPTDTAWVKREHTVSAGDNPKSLLTTLPTGFGYPAKLWRNRWLVQNFFNRHLRSQFRGSVLGVGWILLQPLFQFCVYFVVFGVLFGEIRIGADVAALSSGAGYFAVWLYLGMTTFMALQTGVSSSLNAVMANSNLVKKVRFPSEIIPFHLNAVEVTTHCVTLAVGLVLGLVLGVVSPGWELLLLPVALLGQMLLGMGMGMLLGTAQVFVRDTGRFWRMFSMAWMFMTPNMWFPNRLVNAFGQETADIILHGNPAAAMVMAHRKILGMGDLIGASGDEIVVFGSVWGYLGGLFAWAIAFFLLGHGMFMLKRHKFADLV